MSSASKVCGVHRSGSTRPPTLVLWSTEDDLEQLYGEPVDIWRAWCRDVEGHGIKSTHHMAEQAPADLACSLTEFLRPAQETQ